MVACDYEKLIFSTILQNATPSSLIPKQIANELGYDKFESREHKILAMAIFQIIGRNELPSIPNILIELGEKKDKIGGEVYLRSLFDFTDIVKIKTIGDSWQQWVRYVDKAGKARILKNIMYTHYRKLEKNFDAIISDSTKNDNFEQYVAEIVGDIQTSAIVGNSDKNYKHISSFYEAEIEKISNERIGLRDNVLPIGWPSLAGFGVPRIGVLNVLAGLTGGAKTQLALLMMLGTAINLYLSGSSDYIMYNALEDSSNELYRRMACALMEVDSNRIANGVATSDEYGRYISGLQFLNKLPIYINDNSVISTQELLLDLSLFSASLPGKMIMVVCDYVELFNDSDLNEVKRLASIAEKLHKFAVKNFCCVLLLTQYPEITNPDQIGGLRARGSRAIANASKVFMEMWNLPRLLKHSHLFPYFDKTRLPSFVDINNPWAYILLHKNSNGPIGNIPMRWVDTYTRFNESSSLPENLFEIKRQ